MSEPASALMGAEATGVVTVREAGLHGMIAVKGDLADDDLRWAIGEATGAGFPEAGQTTSNGGSGTCWMAPDEALVMVPYADAAQAVEKLQGAVGERHFLIADISDARAVFTLEGDHVRDVLAKLTPADVSPGAMPPGRFRRTRLAQVAAAFWMPDDTSCRIICFRSVAAYVFRLLSEAAKEDGAVGYYAR